MSYTDQATLSQDPLFINRVAASAAVEVGRSHQPLQWAYDHIWWVAASPGFADAYAYAIANGVENPGADTSVITDEQILAAVQALDETP